MLLGGALALLSSLPAAAQTGGFAVRVVDAEQRKPLPGATVVLTSDRGLAPRAALVAGADGVALFPVLPLGPGYRLEVSMPGFARVVIGDLSVSSGEPKTVPVALLPERVEHETVQAERSVVELSETSTSTKFDDAFLSDLPVQGRFYQNALTMVAGVQDSDGDGNPNVHGARSRDFKATVDGVSNQDPLTGQWLSQVNPDSIEEIEVLTAGAGAEFGRAQGGFGRIIQKQGSNDFEGVASFYYRTSKLDGAGAASVGSDQVPSFDWVQPSVQVSGPIVRDRLWYRLSHEWIDVDEPLNLGNALVVSKRTQQIGADQITWQMSPRSRLAFQYQSDPLERTNVGVTSTVPAESSWSIASSGPTYGLTWTAAYSPTLFVESQAAYQDHRFEISPTSPGVANDCIRGVPSLETASCFNAENGLTSGGYYVDWADHRQRFTARSQATFFLGSFLGMRHEIKTGISVENERYFRDLARAPDVFVWEPTSGVANGPPRGVAVARFSVPGDSNAEAVGTSWGVFVEDRFRPTSNLTASIGARVDVEQIDADGVLPFDAYAESQAFQAALPASDNPVRLVQTTFTAYEGIDQFVTDLSQQLGFDPGVSSIALQAGFWNHTRRPGNLQLENTNVSPRLSVSWDPWSDGKTKVAATAGRYYDKIFLAVPLIELEPASTSLYFDTIFLDDGFWHVQSLTRPPNPAVNAEMVDRNLQTPYKDEYSLSFEREIAQETSLKLTYIRSQFRDQLQDTDINKFPGDYGRCVIVDSNALSPVIASPGMGQFIIDPYSGKTYQDSDPGNGDGIQDDCTGQIQHGEILPDGTPILDSFLPRPDGIPDLYIQNPAWGSIFLVGNFNRADYDAFVLELVRRQFRNWQMEASYTYSKAIGDAEDFQVSLGDDRTTLVDEHGYLSYDQRHVVKMNTAVITPWGFRLGIAASWQSGLPYSLLERDFSIPIIPPVYSSLGGPDPTYRTTYPTHQRNDQRNPAYWNFDVRAAKDIALPKGVNLQLTAEIFNLLDDDTITVAQSLNGTEDSTRRFGRQFQLGFRISF